MGSTNADIIIMAAVRERGREGGREGEREKERERERERERECKYNFCLSSKFCFKLFLIDHGCANHDFEEKRFKSRIHCCDVTKPPYVISGELCTSPLHCNLLFVYTVCCRRTRQCFSVLRIRKSDVILT